MTEGERVREIRKAKNLTLEKFGESFGMSRSSISDIENGRRSLTNQTRLSICREFKVNEEWLRTGDGEMFEADPSEALDALAREYKLRQKDYVLIEKLVKMSPAERDGIFRFMRDVVDGARACGADPDSPACPAGPQEMSPEQLHAELDRQLSDQEGQTGGLSASGRGS